MLILQLASLIYVVAIAMITEEMYYWASDTIA